MKKRTAFEIFEDYFDVDQNKFNKFLNRLSEEKQEKFFNLSIFYKNFVKDQPISYEADFMKNGFAMLMIFSLIEALMKEEHMTFPEFLRKNFRPINNLDDLGKKEKDYYSQFGAVRMARVFFDECVDEECKELFSYAVAKYPGWLNSSYLKNTAKETRISKNLGIFYKMRSKFVHSVKIPSLESPIILENNKFKFTIPYLINDLKTLFEHGFLRYFGFAGNFSHLDIEEKIEKYKKGVELIKKIRS